ncbi:MAG: hypothetical protein GY838_12995 [bacterium]|nr:hypothetical protein [bacterium]
MMLWVLKLKEEHCCWDGLAAVVVRAPHARAARELASTEAGDEGEVVWMDPRFSTCKQLHSYGPAEVVVADFKEA